jgi:hypothetical protein
MTTRPARSARPAPRLARLCGQVVPFALLLLAIPVASSAQLISIKTVPVAQADQFDFFPSQNHGMGGVSIALSDTLLDPFSNPAKGARLRGAHFFGSPTFYSVSRDAGSGRTIPLTALVRSEGWFGGASLALQEVDAARRADQFFAIPGFTPGKRSHNNRFAFGMIGKELPVAGVSVAASVLWAGLEAIDGVDLLYAGSQRIDQAGQSMDVRLGAVKEWAGGRTLEATVVHNRYRMAHDVTYVDWAWDPNLRTNVAQPRVDENLDRTNTSAVHLVLSAPLSNTPWRIGGVATGNRLTHPKIPNYEFMSIPRDPGHSYAYNLGVGLSRTDSLLTFGLDVIYEPIWSNTWADAAGPIETDGGAMIPAGGKTIENHFRFSNSLLRMGFSQTLPGTGEDNRAALQLGIGVRSISYRLEQADYVRGTEREQRESWIEWTPTWGTSFRFPGLEIRYGGRMTTGTGRPGVAPTQFGRGVLADAGVGSTIIAAPSGPLTLDDVRVVSHQLSVSFPIR